jgi:hypothetical protein
MGRNRVHELNRDHVAAPVAELLAGLRLELWKRLRATLKAWNPRPVHACVFGSAARGDGGTDSDIDILLVHQPFPGDADPRRSASTISSQLAGYASEIMSVQLTPRQVGKWRRQVDELHDLVRAWTGNALQAVEMSSFEWADHQRHRSTLFSDISRDAINVASETGPVVTLASGAR